MAFPDKYIILKRNRFSYYNYSLIPIRLEDRYNILKWRNEQIYHLRQNKYLTVKDQDKYFNNIVRRNFVSDKPEQLLFSYLDGDKCIGYGGLVHINWYDLNAEVSFIMDTHLEKSEFQKHWGIYLELIDYVAFNDLNFHKIYTYAFDLRPHLYEIIENKGYVKEATLKEHCIFNNSYYDVIIHSKFNSQLSLRIASIDDAKLYFEWANDYEVRINSFNNLEIEWKNHFNWFKDKLNDHNSKLLVLTLNDIPIGQLRLDKEDEFWLIDYSIDKLHRGKGFGSKMISILLTKNIRPIKAIVRCSNLGSLRVFEKNGFEIREEYIDDDKVFVCLIN